MRSLAVLVTFALAQPPTDADCLLHEDVECPEPDPLEQPEPEDEPLDSEALMDCWAAGLCEDPEPEPKSTRVTADTAPVPQVIDEAEILPQQAAPRVAANRVLVITGGILLGVGIAGIVAGAVLMVVGAGDPPPSAGPTCTTGKRCGQTCIELSDTCHIDSATATDDYRKFNPTMVWSGGALAAVGLGLITGGAYAIGKGRSQPRLTIAPTGLVLRF